MQAYIEMSDELEFLLTLLLLVGFSGLMAFTYMALEWVCLWVRGDQEAQDFKDWINRPF